MFFGVNKAVVRRNPAAAFFLPVRFTHGYNNAIPTGFFKTWKERKSSSNQKKTRVVPHKLLLLNQLSRRK
jgi:hypothetical protein